MKNRTPKARDTEKTIAKILRKRDERERQDARARRRLEKNGFTVAMLTLVER